MIESIKIPKYSSDASEKVIICDMSYTIFKLIAEANHDRYLPGCKSYQLFDEDDAECYGVNPDRHHDVSQECIENYIWLIYRNTQMEQECLIPSIMYLKKLLNSQQDCYATKLRMYSRNWKTIVGMSMLIAAKVWDDFHMDLVSAVQFLYCMDLQRCNKLEILYLKMIDFDVSIKRERFCDYEEDVGERHRSRLSTPNPGVNKQVMGELARGDSEATIKISSADSSPTLRSMISGVNEQSGLTSDLCESASSTQHGSVSYPKIKIKKSNSFCRKNRAHIAPTSPSSYSSYSPDSWGNDPVAPSPSPSGMMAKLSGVVKSAIPFVRCGSAKIC